MTSYGVGFLGSGPVAQAIHVPFIRNFPDELHLATFMDISSDLAEELANQHQCNWTVDEDELIFDPDVQIVVIGSPNNHHARQIIKSCKAGKKLILAEKPLAVTIDELNEIRGASLESGTKIVVGTMHAFDSAYLEALQIWQELDVQVHSIEVNCFIPTNDEFVDRATQLLRAPASDNSAGGGMGAMPTVKTLISGAILGLAMHDIPATRDFAPDPLTVTRAKYVTPWGYLIEGHSGGISVRYVAQLPGEWGPDWNFVVSGDKATLRVQYQPSYVDSGSATISIKTVKGESRIYSEESPYTSEWKEIIRLLEDGTMPLYSLDRISEDLQYALSIIDQMNEDGI